MRFDYLDVNEYLTLTIIHTGNSADAIHIAGKVKEGEFARARLNLLDRFRLHFFMREKRGWLTFQERSRR